MARCIIRLARMQQVELIKILNAAREGYVSEKDDRMGKNSKLNRIPIIDCNPVILSCSVRT